MAKRYLTGDQNRYVLVCEENMDPYDILEQAEKIKELTLKESRKEDPLTEIGHPKVKGKTKPTSRAPDKGHVAGEPHMNREPVTQSTEDIGLQDEDTNRRQDEDTSRRGSSADSALKGEPWTVYRNVKGGSRYKGKSKPGKVPQRGEAPQQQGVEQRVAPRRDGFNERGKREFDRQSGSTKSGVKPIEKRGGGGAHNWGLPGDNVEAPKDASADEGHTDEAMSDASDSKAVKERAKAKDDVDCDRNMTLDEWKQCEGKERFIPSYELRKPGDGEDPDRWGNLQQLKKKSPRECAVKNVHTRDARPPKHKTKQVNIFTEVSANERGAPTRRGGGKNGRTAAEVLSSVPPAEPLRQNASPKFDPSDFPSLGGI